MSSIQAEQPNRETRSARRPAHTRSRALEILLAANLEDFTATQLAERLHLSPSTLRRHLRRQGTSYRQLLDEVRRLRCSQALCGPGIPGKTLAPELGFQRTNSFYRAFSRWAGVPWSEYKRGLAAAGRAGGSAERRRERAP